MNRARRILSDRHVTSHPPEMEGHAKSEHHFTLRTCGHASGCRRRDTEVPLVSPRAGVERGSTRGMRTVSDVGLTRGCSILPRDCPRSHHQRAGTSWKGRGELEKVGTRCRYEGRRGETREGVAEDWQGRGEGVLLSFFAHLSSPRLSRMLPSSVDPPPSHHLIIHQAHLAKLLTTQHHDQHHRSTYHARLIPPTRPWPRPSSTSSSSSPTTSPAPSATRAASSTPTLAPAAPSAAAAPKPPPRPPPRPAASPPPPSTSSPPHPPP